ncbi:MAG TPA: septum formation family protein [Acidimicrobiales bacterium]
MTDASPGPGWWQASDGRWYPPQVDPRWVTSATREPIDWERVAAERAAHRRKIEQRHRLRVGGAALAALALIGVPVTIALLQRDDDDGGRTATTDQTTTAAVPTTTPSTTAPTTTAADTTTQAPTTAPATTTPPGATTVSVFDLQPGTCVDSSELSTGLVTSLAAVPCDQPHSHEVFQTGTFNTENGAYDAAAISAFATDHCTQGFANYVGVPYERSRYYFLHLAPSEESWNEQGDRGIVCLLFLQGAPLSGSARGTAQ